MSTSDAQQYWRTSIHHLRLEIERLIDAISAERRQDCFREIEAIEGTLRTLRASIRHNMGGTGE
jgi:hypothetical protein